MCNIVLLFSLNVGHRSQVKPSGLEISLYEILSSQIKHVNRIRTDETIFYLLLVLIS